MAAEAAPASSLAVLAPPTRVRLPWSAKLALGLLVLVTLGAVWVPTLLPADIGRPSPDQFLPPGERGHLLGTDLNGRDLLHRLFTGARVSLLVGVCGALVSLVIGTTVGVVAGWKGGRVDAFLMRVVDTLYAVPRLIFILLLAYVTEQPLRAWIYETFAGTPLAPLAGYTKILILVFALGMIEWLTMARIVRGQTLALRSLPFITAARAIGQTPFRIITRHLLPNLLPIILIYLTLTVPAVILDESFLSFLGLGVDAAQASWGTLLADGANAVNPVKSHWWLLLFPALLMSLTLLALNFLGDGLRDALDPRGRR